MSSLERGLMMMMMMVYTMTLDLVLFLRVQTWREVISERYVPSNIVIQMGSKVTWTNEDKFPHTITSGNRSNGYDHKFNSGIIALNHSYSYVFSAPGIIRIIVSFIHG